MRLSGLFFFGQERHASLSSCDIYISQVEAQWSPDHSLLIRYTQEDSSIDFLVVYKGTESLFFRLKILFIGKLL